jgi:hypothetical protein
MASQDPITYNYLRMMAGQGNGYFAISHTDQCHFKSLYSYFIPANDVDAVRDYLDNLIKTKQVVIGFGRLAKPPIKGRGSASDVLAFSVIGMDIDILDPAKPNRILPKTIDEAIELLEGFTLPPTAVIKSGSGLHAYWYMDEDVLINDEADLKNAKALVSNFYAGFAEYAKPYSFDHTQDLARVFRVPGFTNRKNPNSLVTVEGVYVDIDRCYSHEQIEAIRPFKATKQVVDTTQVITTPVTDFSVNQMASGCSWFRKAMVTSATASHDAWFATGSLLSHAQDGLERFQKYSAEYPNYDPFETEDKFNQIDQDKAARTCESLAQIMPMGNECRGCLFRQGIKSPVELGIKSRRVVFASGLQLEEITSQLWTATHVNNDPPTMFLFNGLLARISRETGSAEILDRSSATHMFSRIATWMKWSRSLLVSAFPSPQVINDALATQNPPVPVLRRVTQLPLITAKKEIIASPGYHAESAVYVLNGVASSLDINLNSSKEQAVAAAKFLNEEMLLDFPFHGDSSRANAFAAMLQPIVRELYSGPSPLFLIDKPLPGSGASLLANAICYPVLGRDLPVKTWSSSAEERRKQITAHLTSGSQVFMWDNISGNIDCDAFAAVLTTEKYSDRILGTSNQVEMNNQGLWLASGNNPIFSNQLARRIAEIRIIPATDTPTERGGFKHDPLMDWVKQNRIQILEALYVMAIAWINAGCPAFTGKKLASYESWSNTLGGILHYAEVEGFLSDTALSRGTIDSESELLRELIQEWFDQLGTTSVKASEIVDNVTHCEKSEEWSSLSTTGRNTKCGQLITSIKDRYFKIEADGETIMVKVIQNSRKYRLQITE